MDEIAKAPPPGGEGGALEMSFPGGIDGHSNAPKTAPAQEKFQTGLDLTCASIRADELRDCLVREILRASAIGMQAQAALLDGDDDLALDNLRRHWRVIHTSIAPLATELRDLAGGPP